MRCDNALLSFIACCGKYQLELILHSLLMMTRLTVGIQNLLGPLYHITGVARMAHPGQGPAWLYWSQVSSNRLLFAYFWHQVVKNRLILHVFAETPGVLWPPHIPPGLETPMYICWISVPESTQTESCNKKHTYTKHNLLIIIYLFVSSNCPENQDKKCIFLNSFYLLIFWVLINLPEWNCKSCFFFFFFF